MNFQRRIVETLHATSPQRAETRSNKCNALQRTAGSRIVGPQLDWK